MESIQSRLSMSSSLVNLDMSLTASNQPNAKQEAEPMEQTAKSIYDIITSPTKVRQKAPVQRGVTKLSEGVFML